MFEQILVPLDGSLRAEMALPVAVAMARASGGTVLLLRVCTALRDFSINGGMYMASHLEEAMKKERTEVARYLAHVTTSDELDGIGTVPIIADGSPAVEIITEANNNGADIIVMCSHGDTGLKRWLLGSVAQKIIRHSTIPVLILRGGAEVPNIMHPEEVCPIRITVPLDGSLLAEKALVPAAYLSTAMSAPLPAELRLIQILPLVEWWKDSRKHTSQQEMTPDEGREDIAAAQAYLKSVEQRLLEGELAKLPLRVSSRVALASDTAGMIVDVAEGYTQAGDEYTGDVIAMATHGHSGFQRWLLGTVTERVLSATRLPLLIVRPPQEAAESARSEEQHSVSRT